MSANAAVVTPCLSGVAVLDTLEGVRAIVGDVAYELAVASLPTHLRVELDTINALSWVPIEVVDYIVATIARTTSRDVDTLLDEAVRLGLRRSFTTVWRVLLRLTTDAALIARTPVIYKRARNVGELSATMLGHGKAEVVLSGWSDVPAEHLRTIGVSIECVVGLAGRSDVRVRSTRTPAGAKYVVTWRA